MRPADDRQLTGNFGGNKAVATEKLAEYLVRFYLEHGKGYAWGMGHQDSHCLHPLSSGK